jgi:hypothetical protein
MPAARNARATPARRPRLRSGGVVAVLGAAGLLTVAGPAAAEPATTVVGQLVQAWPETAAAHEAPEAPLSWIETAAGDSVRVPTDDVADLPAGATVEVTVGGEVHDEASEDGAETAREVLGSDVVTPSTDPEALPAPAGPLTNEVTVALVTPGGVAPDGTGVEDVVDVVETEVAPFWAQQTDGAITLGVTAPHAGWVPTEAGCSDAALLWNEAAAAVGFEPGPGRHLLIYVPPDTPGCAYALAEIGSSPASGGRLYVSELGGSVLAHEFGHNFGLGHSAGQQCDEHVEAGSCHTDGYRDYYDVMGASWARYGSLNVVHAARLGLIPPAAQQTLGLTGSTTTVTLAPVSGRAGIRALRLTDAEGVAYWLEYRPAAAADAWLGSEENIYRLESGVLVRRADAWPNSSVLLDGSPSAAAGWGRDLQAALPVGAAVPLSGEDFEVTVQSVTAAGAVVSVTAAAPAAPATPGSTAPAPAADRPARVPGGVLSAAPDQALPQGTVVAPTSEGPAFWAPDTAGLGPVPASPALVAASDSTSGTALLVPLAGTVLLGATTLLVMRMRRSAAR